MGCGASGGYANAALEDASTAAPMPDSFAPELRVGAMVAVPNGRQTSVQLTGLTPGGQGVGS